MRNEPIAIIGISALFPGSSDEAGFWRDIVSGRDLITDVPARRWLIGDHYDPDPSAEDKTYCKRGAFLSPSSFDPLQFGVPPNAIPATDTCQLLSLVAAKRVLDDVARGQAAEIDRERTSVILGVTSGQQLFLEVTSRLRRPVWVKALRECGIPETQVNEICDRIAGSYVPWQENTFPGLLGNVVAGRIANRFDLHGTNCVTDAACASSLAAISMAVDELRLRRSDLVITGGADTFNDVSMFVAFSKTPALSPTGDCRPFSDRADGTVLGEGIAFFALKRLGDAERDGNQIYAVIRSIGSSSDGRSKSIYAPLPTGQARAMQRAYEDAGYGPETVELVEAHGTGTAAGDAAEIESLRLIFEPAAKGSRRGWCALGSVKSQVGHTKAAAGAASLFKTAMALHHQVLPPTIKVERPNPALNIEDSPFYLNTTARPWIPLTASGRHAALSSFGFGGTNFHLLLEEYTGANPRPKRFWTSGCELVLLSAAGAGELRNACLEAASLCDADAVPLASIALSTQHRFDASMPHRVAAVASDRKEMARKLRQLAEQKTGPGTYSGAGPSPGKIAFLFPGQGSQYLNMGLDAAIIFREALAVWEAAGETARVVFPPRPFSSGGPEEQTRKLTSTEWAQPALGAASAALLALLDKLGVRCDCVAGHSFGEIPPLFAAGAIDLDTMLSLARKRGELMRDAAAEPAGMISVASDWPHIRELIGDLNVTPANHNGPSQVVLSGGMAPLREAERRLRESGFAVAQLPVSTAFHSPLMLPAAETFEKYVDGLSIGHLRLPFYANGDGTLQPADGAQAAANIARQIAAPVHFGAMIERMYQDGVRTFVEVGPRDVLTRLTGAILAGRDHNAIALDRPSNNGLQALWEGLGALSAAGVAMDWRKFRGEHAVSSDISVPAEPKFSVYIDGGNYGRPYPPPEGTVLPTPIAERPAPAAAPVAETTEAYRIFQDSITTAQREWQENLAKGHEAFLKSMEAAFGSASGTASPALALPVLQRDSLPLPVQPAAPTKAPAAVPSAPASAAVPSRGILWEIVAEKTGYPADMLEPAMALEADLGIDSIKRVEIFSALQERFPALNAQDPAALTALRTLGDILTALEGSAPTVAKTPEVSSSRDMVWQVVAEKTGYPADMLEPGMALEADLGIDSIKRVEIFSALQERFPQLSASDPAALTALRSLADIVAALDGAALHQKEEPPAAPSARGSVWQVVAEKTGYPADMLEAGMALEADLGIDSIKRVEIFSALQQLHPQLSAADPAGMATLKTLGDIVAALDGGIPTVETAAPAVSELPKRYALSWQAVGKQSHSMLLPGDRVAISNDERGVAEALAGLLQDRGFSAIIAEEGTDADAWISLAGLRPLGSHWEAVRFAKAAGRSAAASTGAYVTVEDASQTWTGGLSGLAKTMALEYPQLRIKAIRIETNGRSPGDIAQALLNELLEGGAATEIEVFANGLRTAPELLETGWAPPLGTLPGNPVVVATGGARGVTAACLTELAKAVRARFVLFGRTPLAGEPDTTKNCGDAASVQNALLAAARSEGRTVAPADLRKKTADILAVREIRCTLDAIEHAGSRARYVPVDIRDAAAVNAALGEVRRDWGPIHGLIHAAGVLADRLIADLSKEQFDAVFSTKVDGLRVLLDATSEDPLALLCFFSSVAARYGNRGQAAYAMANEVLNRAAHQEERRRGDACRVRSINWGPWDSGMVTPALAQHFRALNVPLIGLAEGAQAFIREILSPGAPEVVIGGPAPERSRELNVHIRNESHPHLNHHRIQDVPVLPLVEAVGLVLQAAAAQGRTLQPLCCSDIKVLRGIRLEGFHNGGNVLKVRPTGEGTFELISADGTRHYEASVVTPPDAAVAPPDPGPLSDAPWTASEIYGDLLFHGPEFHLIRDIDGVSDRGIAGTLQARNGQRWRHGEGGYDSGMFDGGLQLARLWGFLKLGGPTLPMRVGSLRILRDPGNGPIHCRVSATTGSNRISCDISFFSPEQELLALMTGVEMYAAAGA